MRIATTFQRPTAPIEMADGTVYYFTPVDPADPKSEHVCEVTNEDHIQRLLSITEGYYIPRTSPLNIRRDAPPAQKAAAKAPEADAVEADAHQLAELGVVQLGEALKENPFPSPVLRRALALEKAKTKPRTVALTALAAALAKAV